jgi:hypothetical protein
MYVLVITNDISHTNHHHRRHHNHYKAAWYPDKPTVEQERKMVNFMDALATFYPCSYCAEDFQQYMKQSPIR